MTPLPFEFDIQTLWPYAVVFCRLGGMLLILPGFSEGFVNTRVRIMLAILVTFLVTPVIATPPSGDLLTLLCELFTGTFIGVMMRIFFAALDIAGNIVSFQMNLSSVLVEDVHEHTQTAIPSVFFRVVGTCLIFQTDLHHLFFRGIVGSYDHIIIGRWLHIKDMTPLIIHVATKSFQSAVEISAPFLIFGTAILSSVGIINRLIPNVHVFFVSQPLQIMMGFFTLLIVLIPMLTLFMTKAADVFSLFITGF